MGVYVGKTLVRAIQKGVVDEKNASHAILYTDHVCENCGTYTDYALWHLNGKICRRCGYETKTREETR